MVSSQISHISHLSHFCNAKLLNSVDFPHLFKYWDKHPASLCEAVLLSLLCRLWVSSQGMEEGYKCVLWWEGWQTLDHRLDWCMSNPLVKWTAVPAVSVSLAAIWCLIFKGARTVLEEWNWTKTNTTSGKGISFVGQSPWKHWGWNR